MTEKELGMYLTLCRDVEAMEEELADIQKKTVGAMQMDGQPHGSAPGNPTQALVLQRISVEKRLSEAKNKKEKKRIEIINFLLDAEKDFPGMYAIMVRRYLDGWSLDRIGTEYHMAGMTVSRHIHKFLKNVMNV